MPLTFKVYLMAKYTPMGEFLSRKLEALGWNTDQAAKATHREAGYIEGMTKGHFPLSRRWCDDLDHATSTPAGSTWIDYQKERSESVE